MNKQKRHDQFSELITRHQSELYGYIFAIVRNWGDADDLYQTVCLVLWGKFDSFRPNSSFFAWARQTARITVSNFLSHKKLPSHISEDLLEDIADSVAKSHLDETELYLATLEHCRTKLDVADQDLLQLHYADDLGSRQIADRLQRSQSSVCNSLNRIRIWLLECIQKELARREHSEGTHS